MATSMGTLKVPIKTVVRNVTLNVRITGMTWWTWRLYAARVLIQIATWIAGMSCCVLPEHKQDESDGRNG